MQERVEGNKRQGKNRFLLREQCLTVINKGTKAALLSILQFNINIQVYFSLTGVPLRPPDQVPDRGSNRYGNRYGSKCLILTSGGTMFQSEG